MKNILKGIVIIIIFGVLFLMLNDGKYILFPKKNIPMLLIKMNLYIKQNNLLI